MAFCLIDEVWIGCVQQAFQYSASMAWSVFGVCPLLRLQAALRHSEARAQHAQPVQQFRDEIFSFHHAQVD